MNKRRLWIFSVLYIYVVGYALGGAAMGMFVWLIWKIYKIPNPWPMIWLLISLHFIAGCGIGFYEIMKHRKYGQLQEKKQTRLKQKRLDYKAKLFSDTYPDEKCKK